MSLFDYFLKLEDAESCAKILKAWHKIDVDDSIDYLYQKLLDKYFTMVEDFDLAGYHFNHESDFDKWKQHVCGTPAMGAHREYKLYQLIELLGKLDARKSYSDNKIYFSEMSKDIIAFASIGGYSYITKEDGYSYLIDPKDYMNRPFSWTVQYKYRIMQVHDHAYLKEKTSEKEKL